MIDIEITPTEVESKNIGIYLGEENNNLSAKIQSLYENSPAQNAGLEVGDVIISVDDELVNNDAYKLVELISNNKNKNIKIVVQRENDILQFNIEPEIITEYYLGVIFKEANNNFQSNMYYGFWDTIDFSVSIIDNVKELFIGNITADKLIGPIGISTIVAETNGIADYIYILALISLSLGVTNLLPLPPLDGGKIILLIIEAIRRKPFKEKIEVGIQMIGFFVIISLSLYITYNDIVKLF